MRLLAAYAFASGVLIGLLQLSSTLFTIDLDLEGIPTLIAVFIAVDCVAFIGVWSIGFVILVSVAILHTIWILTGWLLLRNSLKRSWLEMWVDEFFGEAELAWHTAGSQNPEVGRVELAGESSTTGEHGLDGHTPAKLLGTISSLGWILSDGDNRQFPAARKISVPEDIPDDLTPLIQHPGSTYLAPAAVAANLWELVQSLGRRDYREARATQGSSMVGRKAFSTDCERCTYPFLYFTLLAFGADLDDHELGLPSGWYARWLHRNQQFRIGDRTLKEHAQGMKPVVAYSDFWRWATYPKDALFADLGHGEIRDWKRLHRPLRTLASERMRLMSLQTSEGGAPVLGLAPEAAEEGDEVFSMQGRSTPVILREISGDHGAKRHCVVGNAILSESDKMLMDGGDDFPNTVVIDRHQAFT